MLFESIPSPYLLSPGRISMPQYRRVAIGGEDTGRPCLNFRIVQAGNSSSRSGDQKDHPLANDLAAKKRLHRGLRRTRRDSTSARR